MHQVTTLARSFAGSARLLIYLDNVGGRHFIVLAALVATSMHDWRSDLILVVFACPLQADYDHRSANPNCRQHFFDA